jgi:hypothetical protein
VAVQAWFGEDEIEIRPGASCSLALSIENVGDRTETFTIIPAGLTASWTTVTRPNVTLFAGSRDVVEVVIRPPAVHTTSAGPTSAAVRIIPLQVPDDAIVAEATVVVQSFDDRRVSVLQPLQRARRRANYEFMVENHGNNLASCRLHLVDASNRVDGSFDPPAVGVAPGSKSLVRLHLKARRGGFRRVERQLDFDIEATQPDHEPAIGHAALIQPPTFPGRMLWRAAAALAVVAAVVVAWFAVVRPEIRDAAERAVDDRVGDLLTEPTETTVVDTATPGPGGDAPGGSATDGEPLSNRLALSVSVGTTGSQSYQVPEGSRLHLTDVVLQNPNADLGSASLLRNAETLYRWDLGAMNSSNEFEPRVTPVPFEPGDEIVFQATCDGSGTFAGTACEVALLIGGRLVPLDAGADAGDQPGS